MLASLFSPRIALGALAQLCRRLAVSLEAGIDVRTVCAREADQATGLAASRFRRIHEAVERGESLANAMADTDDYFPHLFREMANVGEKTGHLAEIFTRLAEHYEKQIKLRRVFLVAIAWPMTQLLVALMVVGLLIWIMGLINPESDPIGFGLVGTRGLVVYCLLVVVAAAMIGMVIHAIRRGVMWTRYVQKIVIKIPMLGKSLETICLARIAWALHLTLGVGMDVRQALRLSLQSARNARYTDHIPTIMEVIDSGHSIYEAFLETGDYPPEFLDNIHTGEQSGRLAESMALLSTQYHERADAAIKVLTMLAGLAVWAMIAALIIAMIFRIFITAYVDPYQDLIDL